MALLPSSSSSSSSSFTYDVFLSFRGEDTRYNFTGNLYKALYDRGICTFIDDEELQKGEEITPSLLKAIEESKIAIIVLSKNYASSSFCLDELSKILDSIKGKGRLVLPVFYDVDPSDVRKLTGTYGEAMAKLEERFKDDMRRLQNWKMALQQVASLSGWHFKLGKEYEHEFIEKIVEKVSSEIKPITLAVDNYLVGLETKKQDVISLLDVGSDDKVHMLGVHGIGGIGKTTLAVAVYNLISHQFERSCFLAKVRENSEKRELLDLQKKLLFELTGEEKIELTSVMQGISIMQQRLQHKKILLILDDVDKREQLVALAGKQCFSPGSRVIITTRDKHLLTYHEVESTYEVKELNKKDAFELLKWKAFKTDKVCSSYVNILKRAVNYASGLPLALEIVGSHLFKKSLEEWKFTLDRYERIPNNEIQNILKVSFDALDQSERSVFLDIACCFKGYRLEKVEGILHAHHGESKKHHIRVLVEKSIIKIESGYVTLHDLIEDMGKEIVRQESPEDPGKRSRLWFSNDITQVLEKNSGNDKIQIIHMNYFPVKIKWDGKALKKMENLKTLIVRDGFPKNPKYLPKCLRVLEWRSRNVPFDFHMMVKKFENMRVLNIYHCELRQIPDVSGLPNLEEFSFEDWKNLTRIHKSVGLLDKLKILSARGCSKLKSLPPLELAFLEQLNLSFCESLKSFPPMVGSLDKLKILHAERCKKLRSFRPLKLPSLEELYLSSCSSLESISPIVGSLDKLKVLHVERCEKLRSFPPLKLPFLEQLHLAFCESLESFPPIVGSLDKLKILHAERCKKLRSFPPLKLPSLEELYLSSCSSLESISPMVGSLDKLKILRLDNCQKLRSFPPLKLPSLEGLHLSYCSSLESISPMVGSLDKLKILHARRCHKLRSFPPLNFPSLEELHLSYCSSLESFPEILGKMGNITHLHLENTPIKELPFSFQNLTRLRTLYLMNCGIVQLPSSIVMMSELAKLTIKGGGWLLPRQEGGEKVSPMHSSKVEFLQLLNCNLSGSLAIGFKWFANVKELDLSGSQFTILPKCIKQFHFLWMLRMDKCKELKEIRGLPPNLISLSLDYCEQLQEIREIPPSLETFSALNCASLTSSCKRKLLNQELHEAGNTNFLLARTLVPEWFDHQRNKQSISFLFRNKFPALILCVATKTCRHYGYIIVIINGNSFCYRDPEHKKQSWELYHFHLFHMQMENINDNVDIAPLENKWNLAEVRIYDKSLIQMWGIHVLKEKSSMEDIRLSDERSPIIELPFSFQNLCRLQILHLGDWRIVQVPSSIVMLRELANLTIEDGRWLFPKQDEGEENTMGVMLSSNVKCLHLKRCFLSDESLAIGLKWFANVKELDLSGSQFTILPEYIKEWAFLQKLNLDNCRELHEIRGIPQSLKILILDNCRGLQEIRGIPRSLKTFSALNCQSLTSSWKKELLNQELHEAENTRFRLPRVWIPEWFDHQCMQGLSISLWFRNKFPAIVLGVVSPLTWSYSHIFVTINGNKFSYRVAENKYKCPEMYHLHFFHMQMEKIDDILDKELLENKWNHMEVDFRFPFQQSGIHVLKEKSSMEDIRFTYPENDVNNELAL